MTDPEFEALFNRLMARRRDEMRARFNRVLPTGELIFNRFEKAPYLHAGPESSVYDTSVVMGDVQIGSHVWVGPYTLLDGSSAPLKIGNFVSVDTGVTIYTHDSTRHYVSGGISPFERGPVTIGDCTVLGTMSMVCCNVSIGSHCVVAAHSFVNQDVPDCSIVAGIPARIIGKVELGGGGARFVYFRSEEKASPKEVQDESEG